MLVGDGHCGWRRSSYCKGGSIIDGGTSSGASKWEVWAKEVELVGSVGISLTLTIPYPLGKEVVQGDSNIIVDMMLLDGVEMGWIRIVVVKDIEVMDVAWDSIMIMGAVNANREGDIMGWHKDNNRKRFHLSKCQIQNSTWKSWEASCREQAADSVRWILKFIRGVYMYLRPNIVTRKFVDGFWMKSGKLESLLELIQCPWVWCEVGEVSWLIGANQPTDGGSLQEKIFVRLVVHSNIGRLF